MRNKPILRWFLEQLLHLLLYVVGVIVCLFIYPFRKQIRKYNITFLWWFLNDTTDGIDAGDYGRFEKNYIGFLQQCAFRNSHWNLRMQMKLQEGKATDVKVIYAENVSPFILCNLSIFGKQKVFYTINGIRYFRMSKTVKWLNNTRIFN